MDRGGRSVAEWESLVAAYRREGLSQVEFARLHGVGLGDLQRWVRRIRARESRVEEPRPAVRGEAVGFLRVQVAEACRRPPATLEWVEAALPRGVVLRFGGGAAAEGIAAVVGATVERLGC
jgi:transposase-like protein